MQRQKISVALCTYNGEQYIEAQLRSIVNQTWPVDEIIICDDRSSDDTINILKRFSQEGFKDVKVFTNSKNVGAKFNFEKALQYCSGDLILLSDQDDIWQATKVEKFINFFHQHSQALGVFSNGKVIDQRGIERNQLLWDSVHFDEEAFAYIRKFGLLDYLLNMGSAVTGASLALRKEALEYVLPFRLMDLLWHDEWIALRLASLDKLYWLNEPLIAYRVHAQQQVGIPSQEEMHMYGEQFHRELAGTVTEEELRNTVWKRWYTFQKAKQIGNVIEGMQPLVRKAKARFEEAYQAYLQPYPPVQRLLKKLKFYTIDAQKYAIRSQY
jgi:glycosyltransferase involved in cell wall biosynthesis